MSEKMSDMGVTHALARAEHGDERDRVAACKALATHISTLQHEAEEAAGAFDANVLRLKACECIAEGEEGWQTVRDACPSAAAVATLRDQFEALQREADGLREALERIAAGDGVYGAQAHEYKQIARAALNVSPQEAASGDNKP